MAKLRKVISALSWLARRRRRESEMDRELRLHLELETEANLGTGLSPAEASRRARASFGGVEAIKEECREATGALAFESFLQDLRIGLRLITRSPGFSAVAVLTLALGIGGTTAIFSLVDGVLLRPLPYPHAERLAFVYETDRVQGTRREGASIPDYLDLREQSSSFEHLAAHHSVDLTLEGEGEPERLSVARVTASYFAALGLEPIAGRAFAREEEGPAAAPVALLSHGLWRRRFAADPGVVGRAVTLNGEPRTVIGVMPPQAVLPGSSEELWLPLVPAGADLARGRHIARVLGRLERGVELDEAQAEMDLLMARLEQAYPEDNRGRGAFVAAIHGETVRGVGPALRLLIAAVAATLLVVCVNVASLLLAQGAARSGDFALRQALGATRGRILRQRMTESLILATAGGGLGALLAGWGTEALLAAAPADLPRLAEVGVDGRALAATGLTALATWWLFGLVPALRIPANAPAARQAGGGRGASAGRERHRLWRGLVVAQLSLSLVLLVATGLLLRSFWRLQRVDLGFEPRGLLAATVELPASRYPFPAGWPVLDWPQGNRFGDELLERLRALPGVESAALAYYAPFGGGWTTRFEVEGRPTAPEEQQIEAHFRPVTEGYFECLRLPLVAGRAFTAEDRPGAPLVAVVNQPFARRFLGERPLGQRLTIYGQAREVVGVVGEERFLGPATEAAPTFYLPSAQNPLARQTLVVRSAQPPRVMVPEVRALLRELDRGLALFAVVDVEESVAGSLSLRRFTLLLVGLFGATALLLSAVGIYGLLSYLVSQRTRELGIRLALGAERRSVLGLVLGGALALLGAGIGLGIVVALAAGWLLSGMLFGVSSADGVTLVAVATVLFTATLAAAWLPARRATLVNPQAALRGD